MLRKLIVLVAASIITTPANAQDTQQGLIAALEGALERLEEYEQRIQTLESAATDIPAGAVIAFASECPVGWTRFEEAASRFIIGASTDAELGAGPADFRSGSNGEPLTARALGEPNGTETVTTKSGRDAIPYSRFGVSDN